MVDIAHRPVADPRWPITQTGKDALDAEIRAIEAESVRDARAVRRLDALRAMSEEVRIEPDAGIAVVGRRVEVVDEEGSRSTYALALPGEGDPSRGWLSIDSPVGLAVVGRRAGDRAIVHAPGGDWPIAVVGVE